MKRESKSYASGRGPQTPWGSAQHATDYAPGITCYSTASHGGFRLTGEAQDRVEQRFPGFVPFAGRGWYEEDQDWSVVALTFPDLFDACNLRHACDTVRMSARWSREDSRFPDRGWASVEEWIETSMDGSYIRQQIGKWIRDNADKWEPRGGGSPDRGYPQGAWCARFRRVGDGQIKSVNIREYPTQQLYTDSEIDALRAERLAPVA